MKFVEDPQTTGTYHEQTANGRSWTLSNNATSSSLPSSSRQRNNSILVFTVRGQKKKKKIISLTARVTSFVTRFKSSLVLSGNARQCAQRRHCVHVRESQPSHWTNASCDWIVTPQCLHFLPAAFIGKIWTITKSQERYQLRISPYNIVIFHPLFPFYSSSNEGKGTGPGPGNAWEKDAWSQIYVPQIIK